MSNSTGRRGCAGATDHIVEGIIALALDHIELPMVSKPFMVSAHA
jgi:hypothetical protein